MRSCGQWSRAIFLFALFAAANLGRFSPALDRTWIGGNVDWVDGGAATNWTPNDEPDSDDRAIFNTANSVNLGSNNAVNGLALSGGIDFFTNDFDLAVDGLVELAGAGTILLVDDVAGSVTADDVTINADATLELRGGTLTLDEEVGTSLLDVNADGSLQGNGTIMFADAPGAVTTVLVNDGDVTALSRSAILFGAPPVGTLQLSAANANARIDLDGAAEAGVVNVNRNQMLDVNIALADIFNGSINMSHNTTLDMSNAWIMGANATLDVDNGLALGVFPNPNIPASTSTIAGASFSQNGGTITLVDSDGTLQFDAPFTMNSGNFVANGHVIFNANATIGAGANFTRPTGTSNITVEAGRTLTINQANFDLDGFLNTTSVLTVNAGAAVVANLGDYDPDQVTNSYSSTINLNNGDITVNTADAAFVMAGTLNMLSNIDGQITTWNGEPVNIGNDSGSSDSNLNVTGTQQVQFAPTVSFKSDADVDVASGATLALLGTVNFDTVNAANQAEFTGAGRIAFSGQVNVNEAVTLNMVGGTIDLDGLDNVGDIVNVDAPLTINVASMANFGRANGGGGVNTLDVNNNVGTGALTVNLDDAAAEWTLNGPGVMNLVNDNAPATLLAGSDVNINGTLNVTGDVRSTARLDIAGIVNINTAAEPLRLAGGDDANDANTLAGGTINGPGILGADTGKDLRGFGTINANVDFDGAADLYADGGELTVNGAILDVAVIGTLNDSGILNVTGPWSTAVATTVVNQFGGEIRGGEITVANANGIRGQGLVSARVINNTRLVASNFFVGQPHATHVFETAGNDNDWDGAANTGILEAEQNKTLELRDVGAAFAFGGTVTVAANGRVFANGFALDFIPASTINLTAGTYESTSSTDIGGNVTVNAGADSTIKVKNNFFLTFEPGSSTALGGNLKLLNNNINIEAGAAFSSTGGAIIIPDGSHLVADNNADIDVLLNMQGAFRPGNFEGIGRVELLDYQQANTGELYVELTGTGLNAYDRLVASGDAVVDGYLNIDIDGLFVPALGNTFNIITANTVTGQFDYYDISGMPAGLTFHLNYLNNAVQLQVVNKEFFAADFDDDGDVDLTDYAIWKGAFGLNQLGDANGDNISDASDYTIWRDQLGSVSGGAGAGSLFAEGQAAVPEPSLCAFLLGAAGVLLRLRVRSGR